MVGDLRQGYLSAVSPSWRAPPLLASLDLNGNAINQTLADQQPWMRSAGELRLLDMSRNALRGTIPPSLQLPPKLTRLELRGNQLTGTLPPLRLPNTLEQLDLSFNALHGPLSAGWALPDSLRALTLAVNGLSGTLPATLQLPLQVRQPLRPVSHWPLRCSKPCLLMGVCHFPL